MSLRVAPGEFVRPAALYSDRPGLRHFGAGSADPSAATLSGPASALEEAVDGSEEGVLLAARELLDEFEAAEDAAAGAGRSGRDGAAPEEVADGDAEGGGAAQGHIGGQAELAAFVVGDDHSRLRRECANEPSAIPETSQAGQD